MSNKQWGHGYYAGLRKRRYIFWSRLFRKLDFLIHRALYIKVKKILETKPTTTISELAEHFRGTKHEKEKNILICKDRVTHLLVMVFGEQNINERSN